MQNNPWFAATMGLGGIIVGYVVASSMGGLSLPGPSVGGGANTSAPAQVEQPSKYKNVTEAFTAYAAEVGLNKNDFASCLASGSKAAEIKADQTAGSASGIDGTPGFWILGPNNKAKKISGAYPFDTFKETIDAMLNNTPDFVSDTGTIPSVDDDPVIGDDNAKVTIVEFTDFQCPFCGRHYEQTYTQIKSEYIDTGKVKYVTRDFPLSFHPNAEKAAEAANCAADQGKYWQMHDKLFVSQTEWSGLAK